jgi:hypothetical protein
MVLQPGNKLPGNPAANLQPHTDTAGCCTHPATRQASSAPSPQPQGSHTPLTRSLHSLTPLTHNPQCPCPMGAMGASQITTWSPAHCRNTMMTTATAHVWRHRRFYVPCCTTMHTLMILLLRSRRQRTLPATKLLDSTTRIVWSNNPLSMSHPTTHTVKQFNSEHTVESDSLTGCRSS